MLFLIPAVFATDTPTANLLEPFTSEMLSTQQELPRKIQKYVGRQTSLDEVDWSAVAAELGPSGRCKADCDVVVNLVLASEGRPLLPVDKPGKLSPHDQALQALASASSASQMGNKAQTRQYLEQAKLLDQGEWAAPITLLGFQGANDPVLFQERHAVELYAAADTYPELKPSALNGIDRYTTERILKFEGENLKIDEGALDKLVQRMNRQQSEQSYILKEVVLDRMVHNVDLHQAPQVLQVMQPYLKDTELSEPIAEFLHPLIGQTVAGAAPPCHLCEGEGASALVPRVRPLTRAVLHGALTDALPTPTFDYVRVLPLCGGGDCLVITRSLGELDTNRLVEMVRIRTVVGPDEVQVQLTERAAVVVKAGSIVSPVLQALTAFGSAVEDDSVASSIAASLALQLESE